MGDSMQIVSRRKALASGLVSIVVAGLGHRAANAKPSNITVAAIEGGVARGESGWHDVATGERLYTLEETNIAFYEGKQSVRVMYEDLVNLERERQRLNEEIDADLDDWDSCVGLDHIVDERCLDARDTSLNRLFSERAAVLMALKDLVA